VQRLARERVPLTVCPLSNNKLCVYPDLTQHPVGRLLDAGLCVSVHSDDPAYFGGYVGDNLVQTVAASGLSARQAWRLLANGFEAAFIDEPTRARYLQRLHAAFAAAAV